MRKPDIKKSLLAFAAAGALLISGCSEAEEPGGGQEKTVNTGDLKTDAKEESAIVFTDDLDREVSLEKRPERVAALIGSFADIWVDAGGKDSLVAAADDTWTSFDLDLPDTVVSTGGIKNPNMEIILEAQPDFVLASAKNESQKKLVSQFEAAGIPVAYFDVADFDEYLQMLEILTRLTGDEAAYAENGTRQEKGIEAVIAKKPAAGKKVLVLRAAGSKVKTLKSEGSVLGEMLADLGAENIADGDSDLDMLSMEAILDADPDEIFIVYQGKAQTDNQTMKELLESEAWQSLRAVQEDQVHVMDPHLYNLKPNARWEEAYEGLATYFD